MAKEFTEKERCLECKEKGTKLKDCRKANE